MCGSMYFFFSSRRRHTRCSRDWSSDVCSSDLAWARRGARPHVLPVRPVPRRQRSGDGSRDFPRPRAPRGPDLPCYLGHHPVALRVRVGRVHHGSRVVPVVGAAHGPRAALYVLGGGGHGAAYTLLASPQYGALSAGDGETVPDAERGSPVAPIAAGGGGARGPPP